MADDIRAEGLADRPTAMPSDAALFEALVDAAPVGIGIWDREFRCIRLNHALAEMNSLPVEAHVGRKVEEYIPEHWPGYRPYFERALAGEASLNVEFGTREDGVLANYYPIRLHPSGPVDGVALICVNTSNLRQAQAALADNEALLRAITESTPEQVYAKDSAGRMVFANSATLRVIGQDPSLVMGRTDAEWHSDPVEAADVMAADAHVMASGRPEQLEERFSFDGHTGTFLSTKAPWRDGEGNIVGIVGISADITKRKQVEQRLSRAFERLQENQLHLREALRSREEFVGMVSHELRNPLAVLLGSGRLLESRGEGLGAKERSELARNIVREGTRLQQIIDELLELARAERPRQDSEPLVLQILIERTIGAFRQRTPGRPVEFENLSGVSAVIEGRQAQLEQVLDNLLSNADKYSPPEAAIEVVLDWADGHFRVAVCDRGIGIDPLEAERLFEPFHRSERTAHYPGVGIGLAVCQRVAAAHGGRVEALSRDDGGAIFRLWMPGTL